MRSAPVVHAMIALGAALGATPAARATLPVRVVAVEYLDRTCCLHPGEACLPVITRLPPAPHTSGLFRVQIENTGSVSLDGLTSRVDVTSAGLRLGGATSSYPLLPPGGRATNDMPFGYGAEVWAACPGTQSLTITLTDGTGASETLPFTMPVTDCDECDFLACGPATPPPVTGLRLVKDAGSLLVRWDPDPARIHDLLQTDDRPPLPGPADECQDRLGSACRISDPPLPAGSVRFFWMVGDC